MKVEAELIEKFIFTCDRPGHSCSSCDYDSDRLRVLGNSWDEVRDKVAVALARREWTTVKYPSLYTAEFLEYNNMSFQTEGKEKTFDEKVVTEFVNKVYSSKLYKEEAEKFRKIIEDNKIATQRELEEKKRETELQLLKELKEK